MNNIEIPATNNAPRVGEFANDTGSYEQIFRTVTPVIDPGDLLKIEQFFSGYGTIRNAKLLLYTSDDIFDPDRSKITHSINRNDGGGITFGTSEDVFKHTGMYFNISTGIRLPSWSEQTYFFDVDSSSIPKISTEMKIGEAPFRYDLYTKKSIRPGTYYLEFCFTYYDGEKWRNNSKAIDFKVRNFLERHDVLIGSLALLASIVAIIGIAVIPLVKWIVTL